MAVLTLTATAAIASVAAMLDDLIAFFFDPTLLALAVNIAPRLT